MSKKGTFALFIVLLIVVIIVGWANSASIGRVSDALERSMEAITELEETQQNLIDAIDASEDEREQLKSKVEEARERIQDLIKDASETLVPPEPEMEEVPQDQQQTPGGGLEQPGTNF
ncbi:MAG: hypothetical protein R6U52_07150 [Kosmotogaceae bacterium]